MPGPAKGEQVHLVQIEEMTDSVGPSGFPVETWTTMDDRVWMSRKAGRGSERFAAGQISSQATLEWGMSYREDMDPDRVDVPKLRRLKYFSATYDILSADHVGRKEGIVLTTLSR